MARGMQTASAMMIITKPPGTLFSMGAYLNRHESATLESTHARIGFEILITGTSIAINIAYIETESALTSRSGKILPAMAPERVPSTQPI